MSLKKGKKVSHLAFSNLDEASENDGPCSAETNRTKAKLENLSGIKLSVSVTLPPKGLSDGKRDFAFSLYPVTHKVILVFGLISSLCTF